MLAQLLNGLIIGAMYALVAIGFTLVFGVLLIAFAVEPREPEGDGR